MVVTPRRGIRHGTETALAIAAICAGIGLAIWPHARFAGDVLTAQDDPAALADLQLQARLRADGNVIARNIEDALKAGDADLATSLVAIAADKKVALPEDLVARASGLATEQAGAGYVAGRFASGLISGEADDLASLSGTVTGDLFVFGDLRDIVREGKRMAMGEDADRLVMGLAATGIAVTAATYMTAGGAVPVRAGLTLVKDARKLGRIGEGLAEWAARSARSVVDAPALQTAAANASLTRPGPTLTAVRAAFRTERAGGLLRLAKDAGRVGEKAGARGALDTLRIAEGPADVARAARLAESKGGQTRGFLKILGRGALLLAAGAFNLWLWLVWAAIALIGALMSIKSAAERMGHAWSARSRNRREIRREARAKQEQAADIPVLAGPVAPV